MTSLLEALIPERRPLANKTAVVTGAGSGIGRAIALELASQGAHVVVGYNERGDRATGVAMEIRTMYGENHASVRCIPLEAAPVVTELECDILVNNAAITAGRSVGKTHLEDWQAVIDINLTGAFKLTQAVLGGMIDNGYGRIVNIVSVVGLDGRLGPATYATSKAGLVGFTKATANELAHKGITVNAVAPGFIASGMLYEIPIMTRDKLMKQIPMGRFGQPEDVAQAVGYLVNAPYVTGTVLNVSGGYLT